MSFNKRLYNLDKLKALYLDGGIEAVQKSFANIDAYIFEDDESKKVFDHIIKNNLKKAIKFLEK